MLSKLGAGISDIVGSLVMPDLTATLSAPTRQWSNAMLPVAAHDKLLNLSDLPKDPWAEQAQQVRQHFSSESSRSGPLSLRATIHPGSVAISGPSPVARSGTTCKTSSSASDYSEDSSAGGQKASHCEAKSGSERTCAIRSARHAPMSVSKVGSPKDSPENPKKVPSLVWPTCSTHSSQKDSSSIPQKNVSCLANLPSEASSQTSSPTMPQKCAQSEPNLHAGTGTSSSDEDSGSSGSNRVRASLIKLMASKGTKIYSPDIGSNLSSKKTAVSSGSGSVLSDDDVTPERVVGLKFASGAPLLALLGSKVRSKTSSGCSDATPSFGSVSGGGSVASDDGQGDGEEKPGLKTDTSIHSLLSALGNQRPKRLAKSSNSSSGTSPSCAGSVGNSPPVPIWEHFSYDGGDYSSDKSIPKLAKETAGLSVKGSSKTSSTGGASVASDGDPCALDAPLPLAPALGLDLSAGSGKVGSSWKTGSSSGEASLSSEDGEQGRSRCRAPTFAYNMLGDRLPGQAFTSAPMPIPEVEVAEGVVVSDFSSSDSNNSSEAHVGLGTKPARIVAACPLCSFKLGSLQELLMHECSAVGIAQDRSRKDEVFNDNSTEAFSQIDSEDAEYNSCTIPYSHSLTENTLDELKEVEQGLIDGSLGASSDHHRQRLNMLAAQAASLTTSFEASSVQLIDEEDDEEEEEDQEEEDVETSAMALPCSPALLHFVYDELTDLEWDIRLGAIGSAAADLRQASADDHMEVFQQLVEIGVQLSEQVVLASVKNWRTPRPTPRATPRSGVPDIQWAEDMPMSQMSSPPRRASPLPGLTEESEFGQNDGTLYQHIEAFYQNDDVHSSGGYSVASSTSSGGSSGRGGRRETPQLPLSSQTLFTHAEAAVSPIQAASWQAR